MPWTRELDHPVYLRGALLLCQKYRISRAAVRVIVDEAKEAGGSLTWEKMETLLVDRILRGEVHQTDPPEILSKTVAEGISTEQLLEENQRLVQYLNCKVCGEMEANVVMLPCCHLVVCRGCAADICHCPVCNTMIKEKVNIYRA